MTPMPTNPTVVVLMTPEGKIEAVASNIAKVPELDVMVTSDPAIYRDAALGKPFNTATDKVN